MDKAGLIRKMLEQDRTNGSTWYLLALEYSACGLYSEAMSAYSEALKYGGDEMKTRIFQELSKLSSGKPSETPPIESDEVKRPEVKTEDVVIENKDEQEAAAFDNLVPIRIIQGRMSNKLLHNVKEPSIDFNDVGGLDGLKEIIRMKIIKPYLNPTLFNKFKKKTGGGILLFGPPGCGKTFIAKATAGECGSTFITVKITDILASYLGESAQNIKAIFSNARAKKPCVIFIDEIDTIGYSRSKLSSEYMRSIIDQLLSEIDGIDANTDKLLIIGATNMPWDVDSAFKRPGRFDKAVFVPPPDEAARVLIFKLKLKDKPTESIDYELLAQSTELYSGADIENVVETATEKVINDILSTGIERPISTRDLADAISTTSPSTVEWLRTIGNYVKYANQSGLYNDVDQFLSKYKKILG